MDILINHDTLNLSFDEIKQMIEQEKYIDYYISLPTDINLEDDKNHGVPMMNEIFYQCFLRYKRIPHWQEFCDTYANMHCIMLEDGKMTFKLDNQRYQYTFNKKALIKKLLRAYMSFLKELYILYWFFNKGVTTACYSLENDKAGYDITVINRFSHLFGIKVYSNTRKANNFANIKKNGRNILPENSTSIAIRPFKDSILGDTYVFSDKLLNGIYHYINNNIQKDIIF